MQSFQDYIIKNKLSNREIVEFCHGHVMYNRSTMNVVTGVMELWSGGVKFYVGGVVKFENLYY